MFGGYCKLGWILPIVLVSLAISAFCGGLYIKRRIERFSRTLFGTNSLLEGFENQKRELAVTPKSVSSMTTVFLPIISRDFPDFNFEEFRQKSENMLISALMAITKRDVSYLTNASDDLKSRINLQIVQDKTIDRHETFSDVTIHRTEITNYKKQMGTCVITLQSAVGYTHYVTQNGALTSGSRDYPEQTIYNIDIVYVQDAGKLVSSEVTAVGTTCPNCGAPITNLGAKFCEYCQTAIEEINIHVWSINKFSKI